jgi:hypothetical protein
MPWQIPENDSEFYRFMGQAGATIPARLLPKSAREAMSATPVESAQPPEQDPDEQAHEQCKGHK